MKEVLLIITGSVAAFKSLELIRLLKKDGYNVKVILTKGGGSFVTPLSASSLSKNEVFMEDSYKMEHISLSRTCDLIVVCPASASFINKLSAGIGGELALDVMLAKKQETQVLLCPAMNCEMWKNETVQKSIKCLEERNFIVINPQSGMLLCEEEGEGKLAPIEQIKQEIDDFFAYQNSFKGLKFLITNGGTIERIDDVRFISNFSSGLQGALITKEILKRGGEVFLVEARVNHNITLTSKNLHLIKVESAKEMLKEVQNIIQNHTLDGFFAVAAVSDFCVKKKTAGKIKKDTIPTLELEYNPDILEFVGNLTQNRPKKIIGFAVEEEENLITNGTKKLIKKNCDVIFANKMCFENSKTNGYILTKDSPMAFEGSKQELAKLLINYL